MKKQNLFIMVGVPGSGKSTFAKEKILKENENTIYVSRDEIRFSYIGCNDAYFAKEKDVFRDYIDKIQAGLDEGKNVIADATHLNIKSRHKLLFSLHLNDNIDVVTFYMKTPLDVCLKRNQKREEKYRVPEDVIRKMYNTLITPRADEYDNMIRHIVSSCH